MPRLFERFHRIEGAQGRTHEGTGIGLALVQEVVKLHGGTIWVDSVQGRGGTFHVALPLGSDRLPADRVRAAPALASTALRADVFVEEALRWLPDTGSTAARPDSGSIYGTLGGECRRPLVVLADDNADMRDYVRRILEQAGCDIVAASDGEEALAVSRVAQPPDLVLTDVMMPKLDGFGLPRSASPTANWPPPKIRPKPPIKPRAPSSPT